MTSLFKCVSVAFLFHIGSVGALEVTFATFNTFWLFDNDPPYQNWWNENRGRTGQTYQQAINAVAEAIKSTGADIIALQEIEDEEIIADLKARLRDIGVDYPFSWIGMGSDTFTGQDVALLSKFPQDGVLMQEYPDEREYYLTETDPGSEAETGLLKVLRVDLNIDNEIVSVFVFHLKSNGGGFEADQQRLAQASIIRRITLPLIQDGRKFVVMGDLNADRGSPAILRIRGLDDIYPDLTQTTYDNNFIGNKWSFEYQGRTQQLDYILLSPALRRTMKSGKINYSHGHDASDHYPVIVVLDIQ